MRGNIRQINDYYPYGLTWSRPEGDDARMYQNKQWQQNEWGEGKGLEMYDFHARMYDPILARWHAPDPMNQFDSPYNAMGNNPVVNIDPDGMWVPLGGILSALSRIQITETVKHCTNAARMTFENITVSKNLFGQLAGVMDVAGGLLAFGEGALILSEGQKELGAEASANMETPPTYTNNENQGFQIHYSQYGESKTVSITKLNDEELVHALIASGNNAYVRDVVLSFLYLREADKKNRNILERMAKSKRTTDIWQTKQQSFYKIKTTGSDIDSKKGVHWSPTKGYIEDYLSQSYQTPAMGLFFEIGHAYMRKYHPVLFWTLSLLRRPNGNFKNAQERLNLIVYERPVSRDIAGEVVRTNQAGEGIELSGPTSHSKY